MLDEETSGPVTEEPQTVNLADMNRATRRRYRRALNAEYRKSTRYHRRASTMSQTQVTILAKETQRRQVKRQQEIEVLDRAYGLEIARV